MATFLEKLLKNASTSVSEGIQKRIDDGTFNRMAEGVGSGLSSVMGGMATVVGMAETAFAKLKEKATSNDDGREDFDPSRYYQQPATEPQPIVTEENGVPGVFDDELEAPQRHVVDISQVDNNFMERLIDKYDMEGDDYATYLESLRLTAQIGIFFAACDGNFTQREYECIERFKEMAVEYSDHCVYEDADGNERDPMSEIFDEIDHPYTIDDIITLTHHLLDPMDEKQRKECLSYINELAQQVVEADYREDSLTDDYYEQWRSEFMD